MNNDLALTESTYYILLSLSWEEGEQEFRFTARELGSLPELRPERPLLLKLVIYGDLPNCGFSYSRFFDYSFSRFLLTNSLKSLPFSKFFESCARS